MNRNEEMTIFSLPEMKIIRFDKADIVATSGPSVPTPTKVSFGLFGKSGADNVGSTDASFWNNP